MLSLFIGLVQIVPSYNVSAAEKVNIDLTLNRTAEQVKAGDNAVFVLDFKVSGAHESIQEDPANLAIDGLSL